MIEQGRKVCILDYGSGNTRSVFNMLQRLEPATVLSSKTEDIRAATHLILSGVGAFGAVMSRIRERLPMDVVEEAVFEHRKPFLGVCVGMQVLADKGYEFGEQAGLGWIPGEVRRLPDASLPLPHVGWNSINHFNKNLITADLGDDAEFYFVHSYAFTPADKSHSIATTEYGTTFTSIVGKDNIYGVQFHPEKSQRFGALLLNNFLKLNEKKTTDSCIAAERRLPRTITAVQQIPDFGESAYLGQTTE